MTLLGKNIWIKTSPTLHKALGEQYRFEFLQLPPGATPEVIETDVLVIGSGCGAGVCAKNLAESGQKTLVVDKGYHFSSTQFPMPEAAGFQQMFENGGMIQSDDGSIAVMAGATWGGGGTINWSVSLQTQDYVRKEWAEARGLSFFASQEFQECLDRVCERMGVSSNQLSHNHGNQVLLEGARRLGASVKEAPQNTGGHDHLCGRCTLGCASAEKQGPAITWLPDAAKAGATFMEGLQVERILFDDTKSRRKAIGAQGIWISNPQSKSAKVTREVVIHAKRVILSCGSLWSPVILLNSGLKVCTMCGSIAQRWFTANKKGVDRTTK